MDKKEFIHKMSESFIGHEETSKQIAGQLISQTEDQAYYQGFFDGLYLFIAKNPDLLEQKYANDLITFFMRAAAFRILHDQNGRLHEK